MKNSIISLLFVLSVIPGYSQDSGDDFPGRFKPAVKKGNLEAARFVGEITTEFWRNLVLPYEDRIELDRHSVVANNCQAYYPGLLVNNDSKILYYVVDYAYVEISATCNGKTMTAESTGDELTPEQKSILKDADLNTEINIKIRFKYKGKSGEDTDSAKLIEGELAVTVIPETEAEFPGGNKMVTKHLVETVTRKLKSTSNPDRIQQAVVQFTVNEEGHIDDAKIFRSSSDQKIDKLLIDAMNKMPIWKPAENQEGVKVKQEFIIRFGGDGC